nr:hypothetical protein [Tanacetum cinerariifolium]
MTPPSTHIDTTLIPIVSPTIPTSPDYTPASPDYTHASPDYSPASDTKYDPSEDLSSDNIPPLPAILPFLSSTDDSLDNDIPDTPPSPTHEPSSGMRPSHHLCSFVPSVPRLSVAITDRPSHDFSSASPSRKRSRSHVAYVPLSLPIPRALSSARADLLPLPKRIRSFYYVMDLEDSSAKKIDECIVYADALRDRWIDVRVVVKAVDRDEVETGMRGPEEGAVQVTYETLGDLVQSVSFGVDAAKDFKEIHQVIKTAGERLSAAKPN